VALAAWDRISHILNLESDWRTVAPAPELSVSGIASALLEFPARVLHYPDGTEVLHNNSFRMEKERPMHWWDPPAAAKQTTASLIARLFDPTPDGILLDGKGPASITRGKDPEIGFHPAGTLFVLRDGKGQYPVWPMNNTNDLTNEEAGGSHREGQPANPAVPLRCRPGNR